MNSYQLTPNFLLRTPLLPLKMVVSETLDFPLVLNIFKDPMIQEALFLASPNLHLECIKYLNDEILNIKDKQKVEFSLLRYLIRMCSRSTPFGLFAGVYLGKWDQHTNIVLNNPAKNKKHTRLDMQYLCALGKRITAHKDIKPYVRYYPNSSLYEIDNSIRYVEGRYSRSNSSYAIAEVASNEILKNIIKFSKDGKTIGQIKEHIVGPEIDQQEAFDYIMELVEAQLLTSELEPAITGIEYLDQILSFLNKIKLQSNSDFIELVITSLNNVKKIIKRFDAYELGTTRVDYERIAKELAPLGTNIDLKFLFQVDMIKTHIQCSINNKLAGKLRKGITILNSLTYRETSGNLENFGKAFQNRFEGREVPLLLALDNESGVGYLQADRNADINPLVDNIYTPRPASTEEFLRLNKISIFLQQKYLYAIKHDKYEIQINDSDLKEFPPVWDDLPDSIVVMGSLLDSDLAEGILYIKSAASSSSIANLLGRFTHSDEKINEFVKTITDHEQKINKNTILAEIVHLPQSRYGNVLLRKRLRDFEIPFIARASVDREHQIPLSDLTVSINSSGRIILKSVKLKKEIVPRLASAHNFSSNSLPIYQFLCELQFQGHPPGLSIPWNQTGVIYPFRPRISYSNIILDRASWRFKIKDLEFLSETNESVLIAKVDKWRNIWKIPQYIVLVEFDNELLVDLKKPLFIKVFIDAIKNKNDFRISEFIFSPKGCIVKDIQGSGYTNEFIASFIRKESITKNEPHLTIRSRLYSNIKRTFLLGSEWLYYKIYVGFKTADEVLVSAISSVIELFKVKGIIKKWYFVRYSDPEFHLRIRINLVDAKEFEHVVREMHKTLSPLIECNKIFKVQTETYVRELERYGPLNIGEVENIFHQQSEVAINFLKIAEESPNLETLRLLVSLRILDHNISQFITNKYQKKRFVQDAVKAFEKEFLTNSVTTKQLSAQYRKMQSKIFSVFNDLRNLPEEWCDMESLVNKFSSGTKNEFNEMKLRMNENSTNPSLYEFIWSVNHMFMNKISRSVPRKHELLLYWLLNKYYGYDISSMNREKP